MAGECYAPWYVMVVVKLITVLLAALAAMMAVRMGGVIGWTGFCLGAFAMFEFELWVDWQWPEMRD